MPEYPKDTVSCDERHATITETIKKYIAETFVKNERFYFWRNGFFVVVGAFLIMYGGTYLYIAASADGINTKVQANKEDISVIKAHYDHISEDMREQKQLQQETLKILREKRP